MVTYENNKETEFNSSLATLIRIDKLIRHLHDLSRGLVPTNEFGIPLITTNPSDLYLKTTRRLFMEGEPKFLSTEVEECETIFNKIKEIKKKYGHNIYLKNISKGMPPCEYPNINYYIAWNELMKANEDYERIIIKYLDKHGMLMKDKDARLAAARV